jgi:hypothetical protein
MQYRSLQQLILDFQQIPYPPDLSFPKGADLVSLCTINEEFEGYLFDAGLITGTEINGEAFDAWCQQNKISTTISKLIVNSDGKYTFNYQTADYT